MSSHLYMFQFAGLKYTDTFLCVHNIKLVSLLTKITMNFFLEGKT